MRVLEEKEKALGAEHVSTLNTVNNLSNLYRVEGRLEKTGKVYMQALEEYKKTPEADHTSKLGTVNNSSSLYAFRKS